MLFVVGLLDTQSREERNETQPMVCAGWILIQSTSTASSRGRERDTQGLEFEWGDWNDWEIFCRGGERAERDSFRRRAGPEYSRCNVHIHTGRQMGKGHGMRMLESHCEMRTDGETVE